MGFAGEETSGDNGLCWITKTHYPGKLFEIKFHANKMIVIARNPIDIIPSMMQLVNMLSHSKKQNESFKNDLTEYWEKVVKLSIKNIKQSHSRLMLIAEKIPTYFVRFEDICTDPASVLL